MDVYSYKWKIIYDNIPMSFCFYSSFDQFLSKIIICTVKFYFYDLIMDWVIMKDNIFQTVFKVYCYKFYFKTLDFNKFNTVSY